VYVGDPRGSLVTKVEKYFCLTTPALSLQPGTSKKIAATPSQTGSEVERFFNSSHQDALQLRNNKIDRILVHDSAHNIEDITATFENMMRQLHKFGKALFIHRAGTLNTLPVSRTAKHKNAINDLPFIDIIKALEATGADVQWDLVHVPFQMSKRRWFSMMREKYPEQPHAMNGGQTFAGMQQLAGGSFRYLEDAVMEGEDRLLLITASHRSFDCSFPSVQRCRGASQVPYHENGDLSLYLPVDEEVSAMLQDQ